MTLPVLSRDASLATRESKRRQYAEQSRSPGTLDVYKRHWIHFCDWCSAAKEPVPSYSGDLDRPVDPRCVADYLISMAERGLSASTLSVAAAAIGARHLASAIPTPTAHPGVREVLAGAARQAAREGRGRGPADPLMPDELRRMLTCVSPGLIGIRNSAILSFGLASGMRREEISRLQVTDLRIEEDGIRVRLSWSKTDQTGHGHERRVAAGDHPDLCPVQWIRTWLSNAGHSTGPLFRAIDTKGGLTDHGISPRRIDQIVREHVAMAREKHPDTFRGGRYSAHSLRAGLATAALLSGKDVRDVQTHLGHKSVQTTLRYHRAASVRESTVTKGIGL